MVLGPGALGEERGGLPWGRGREAWLVAVGRLISTWAGSAAPGRRGHGPWPSAHRVFGARSAKRTVWVCRFSTFLCPERSKADARTGPGPRESAVASRDQDGWRPKAQRERRLR